MHFDHRTPSHTACRLCPRSCGVPRGEGRTGYCGMPEELYVSRIAPHMWEEPPISGTRGSGTVFFTGCNLRCVFCQNRVISHEYHGRRVSEDELMREILELEAQGVHNINLVTPTHYTYALVRVLEKIKPRLGVPVVWNSSGYESPEALAMLNGLVDIYLPDFKFISPELSTDYAGAPDYGDVASRAIQFMYSQVGTPVFDGAGMMQRGVIVRHLVLPGCRKDSMEVLRRLTEILPTDGCKISLMRQYTPEFAADCPYPNLHRRVTDFEYTSVVEEALSLGLDGYTQDKSSATSAFTPDFT